MFTSKAKLTKNVLSLSIVQIANYVLPIVSVPIISRIIGPDKYGVINFAASFIAYFNLLIGYGFDYTATRKISSNPNDKQVRNYVFSQVFYTQCFLFVISMFLFTILLSLVPQLKAEKEVMVFSFLTCIATLITQNWLFQAMQDLPKIALLNFVTKLLFIIVILYVVRVKEDYIWMPLLASIIQILVSAISFAWSLKRYKIALIRISFKECLKLLSEERMIFFSVAVVTLYTSTNTFILGLYQNSSQVGYYSAGQRLIVMAQSVLTIPLAQALYPFIGNAFATDKEKGLRVAHRFIPPLVILTLTVGFLMFFLGPVIISLFYGNKFTPSISVFQILVFIPFLIALSNVFGIQIMLNLKMDKAFFRITACGAVLSILLNFLMVKRWGYIGTAYNWLITESFITVTMYIILRWKGINPVNLYYFKLSFLREFFYGFTRRNVI